MRKGMTFWDVVAFLWTLALGTLLHFTYAWSGYSRFVAAFSAVNESTWEHMKILFVPLLLFTLAQLALHRELPCGFFAARGAAASAGVAVIPVVFYVLNGCFGKTPTWVNLSIFALSALVAVVVDRRVRGSRHFDSAWLQILGVLVLLAWTLAFAVFTYHAPRFPLFADPRSGTFGLTMPF